MWLAVSKKEIKLQISVESNKVSCKWKFGLLSVEEQAEQYSTMWTEKVSGTRLGPFRSLLIGEYVEIIRLCRGILIEVL